MVIKRFLLELEAASAESNELYDYFEKFYAEE